MRKSRAHSSNPDFTTGSSKRAAALWRYRMPRFSSARASRSDRASRRANHRMTIRWGRWAGWAEQRRESQWRRETARRRDRGVSPAWTPALWISRCSKGWEGSGALFTGLPLSVHGSPAERRNGVRTRSDPILGRNRSGRALSAKGEADRSASPGYGSTPYQFRGCQPSPDHWTFTFFPSAVLTSGSLTYHPRPFP